jgi:hypothetical protein
VSFKVGDFVELVSVNGSEWVRNIGYRGIVVETFLHPTKGACVRFEDAECAEARNCRLVPPDEPQSDFTPGDWELCPFNPYKQRVRV